MPGLNYTDEELLGHLEDLSPSQMATVNAAIAINKTVAILGPITIGSGTSEPLTDISDDIANRSAEDIAGMGETSRTGGWGTIVDGLPG